MYSNTHQYPKTKGKPEKSPLNTDRITKNIRTGVFLKKEHHQKNN